ncbi:MAG: hypothetical protein K940chlam5_00122 [Candidatus Anoxychlamydiales bacterium]|nr:hypothetical protein [Candidatus Anoxychlamydiales bacterium]
MRKIIFLLIIPFLLFAQDESYKISADILNFEKNNLHFDNGFYLEHSFGKIFANSARFSNLKKANRLVDFSLKNGVKLITNANGTLISENADFDSFSSQIRFYSKDFVTYVDKIKSRDLKIISNEVKCLLDTKNAMKKLNIEDIYSISFLDKVTLSLDNQVNIYCQEALFEKKENESKVFLYPKDNDFCRFTYENSEIFAEKATLDVDNLDLELENTRGQINNLLKNKSISFVASRLNWHNFENSFSLNDNVKVIDPEVGEILSNQIELLKNIDQKSIRKIISRNNTTINFFSKNKSYLFTQGIIELDHEKKKISAFSLKNQDHYLVYVDENVSISAKKATLLYDENDNIKNIVLENSVRFKYTEDKNFIGYGLADKIEYLPLETKVLLSSDKDKKVLFWQEDKSLKLSANEIHINPKEKNDIKGLGDVRFTFNLEEQNLIHDIFSKYTNYE